jgi:SAM-dependent methyltransferase
MWTPSASEPSDQGPFSYERTVLSHFTARAPRYDASSRWCTDRALIDAIFELARPTPDALVLDVASGTGLVAERFRGRVRRLVGLDLTPAMLRPGRRHVDAMVRGLAEKLPFQDGIFDIAMERQGIQFMDARLAVSEMVRVVRPGGRVVLVQLCAWGASDRDDYFEILRLRNPARRNFFMRGDLESLLQDAGCVRVEAREHVSRENVDRWADNGAIPAEARLAIREVYRRASPEFLRLHAVEIHENGETSRFMDDMLFTVAVGFKEGDPS